MESHKQSNRAERTKQRPAAQKDSNELYNDDDEDYDSDDIELLDLGDEAVLFGFDKAAAAEDDDKDNADHYQTDLDHIVTASQDVTSPYVTRRVVISESTMSTSFLLRVCMNAMYKG